MHVALQNAKTGQPLRQIVVPDHTGQTWLQKTAAETAVRQRLSLANVDLRGCDLQHADLHEAHMSEANLAGANLTSANLNGANLRRADLSSTNLSGVNATGASLRGADLRRANLLNANLTGVNLRDAQLRESNLSAAHLRNIRRDLQQVLKATDAPIRGLIQALRDGRVDGAAYDGRCCCLIGTIAHLRAVQFGSLPNHPRRPAERWFLAIRAGDTPASNPVCDITVQWLEEFEAA